MADYDEFDDADLLAQHDQEAEDLRAIMARPEGRRFMWRLLSITGIYHSSFSTDHGAMAYGEGKRSVGLQFLGEIVALSHSDYILMLQEKTNV